MLDIRMPTWLGSAESSLPDLPSHWLLTWIRENNLSLPLIKLLQLIHYNIGLKCTGPLIHSFFFFFNKYNRLFHICRFHIHRYKQLQIKSDNFACPTLDSHPEILNLRLEILFLIQG